MFSILNKKAKIDKLIPSKLSNKDWEKYHTFKKEYHEYYNKNDQIAPKEQEEKMLTMMENHPEMDVHFWWLTKKEKIVGIFFVSCFTSQSASYENNKNLAQIDVRLLPETWKNTEITKEVIKKIIYEVKNNNQNIIMSNIANIDQKKGFIDWGFSIVLDGQENRLDLTKINWTMVKDWVKTSKEKNPKTRLKIFQEMPEDFLESYCKTYTETLNQQPLDSLDIKAIIINKDLFRQTEKDLKNIGQIRINAFTLEENGDVSGLTEIIHNPTKKNIATQGLTGVLEHYRGKKLGKWLKAEILLHLKDNYPTIQTIKSDNASSNDAMNAINQKLGFFKHKESSSAQLKID